jgi:hypothetical protein
MPLDPDPLFQKTQGIENKRELHHKVTTRKILKNKTFFRQLQ